MKKILKRILAAVLILAIIAGGTTAFYRIRYINANTFTVPEMESEKEKYADNMYVTTPDSENIIQDEDSGVVYVNNEVLIYATLDVTYEQIEAMVANYDLKIIGYIEEIGFYQLRTKSEQTYRKLQNKVKQLEEDPYVFAAMINSVNQYEGDFTPNDPWDKNELWSMKTPGGSNWGVEAIHAPGAWEYLSELMAVNVGVIDDRINGDHEDLTVTAYVNDGKEGDNHGTHVAGTIAAEFDNGRGVSGVCPTAKLYSYATSTYLTDAQYVSAITALTVVHNVKVINISQNTNRLVGFAADHGNKNAIKVLESSAKAAGTGLRRLIDKGYEFVLCVAAGNNKKIAYYEDSISKYGYSNYSAWPFAKSIQGGTTAKYNNFLNAIEDEVVVSRIICVGAVGLDRKNGNMCYADFANEGSRVDVVAPGVDIYSSYWKGYDYMSGTSMATPHVSGVAALVFACNPDLTGAQVKQIVCATATGRYYMDDGNYAPLVQADAAVEAAIASRDQTLGHILHTGSTGLDLCFVIDTTGSMGDEINDVKKNMKEIIAQIVEKTEDYRIAVIDYRDFYDRTGDSRDYPSKVQLNFTDDYDSIINAVNGLNLGFGGDDDETVYSGIMEAINLNWRMDAEKTIILMGDAEPLDPEPNTGYTYSYIATALYNAGITPGTSIKEPETDILYSNADLGIGDASDSLISVYSIDVSRRSDSDVTEFFTAVSEATGGMITSVNSADEVAAAISDSIEQIELDPTYNVKFNLEDDYANESIRLYQDGEYLFTFTLDERGATTLAAMPEGKYKWENGYAFGTMKVAADTKKAKVTIDEEHFHLSDTAKKTLILVGVAVLAVGAVGGTTAVVIVKWKRKKNTKEDIR